MGSVPKELYRFSNKLKIEACSLNSLKLRPQKWKSHKNKKAILWDFNFVGKRLSEFYSMFEKLIALFHI
ncbi:hypothetical protein DCC62_25900 [candidate division KSB1 bacterium]|nr:MAG: hypothetical protein DCC62_25900 [candidate division KSB1 bacterium]